MKPSIAEVQKIAPGDIFQVCGEDTHYPLRLLVAQKIESWGIYGYIAGVEGNVSRAWNLIEQTGGRVAFGRDGKPFIPAPATPKHHE